MGVVLDIIGSFIIRAAIVSIILVMMVNLHDALNRQSDRAALAGNIDTPAEVLTTDLKMAGYGKYTSKVFPFAQKNKLGFYADIDDDSVQDNILFTKSAADANGHCTLYRTVNGGTALEIARDVVTFDVTYFNVYGAQVAYGTNVSGIKSVYISLVIESNNAYSTYMGGSSDTPRNKVSWQRQIFPPNL